MSYIKIKPFGTYVHAILGRQDTNGFETITGLEFSTDKKTNWSKETTKRVVYYLIEYNHEFEVEN